MHEARAAKVNAITVQQSEEEPTRASPRRRKSASGGSGHERRSDGYLSAMDLLLIPLILVGVFLFPFAMAWLEPKQMHAPTHRRDARRTEWR